MTIPIFIINLKKDIAKKKQMKEILDKFNITYNFFDAIYWKELDNNVLKEYKKLSPWEVGCLLSHIYLFKKIIKNNIKKVIILEDDIIIDSNFVWFVWNIENIHSNLDILFLWHHHANSRREEAYSSIWYKQNLFKYFFIKKIVHKAFWTYGYLITFKWAKKLLDYISKIDKELLFPIDHYTWDIKILNSYIISPVIVKINNENENESTINIERKEKKKNNIIYLFLSKIFYFLYMNLLVLIPTRKN